MTITETAKLTVLTAETKFCGSCDEYVQVLATAQLVDEDEGTTELEIADDPEFECKDCGSDDLYEDEFACGDVARDRYLSDMADAKRKGEW